ncbi:putative acyl-activating enzyme 1, peroxisomal [Mycena indigotica]|uniref:Putative acyl-activating enzyme 1, peroxisomal n=1 Tax=Mycena indigotica TaxID=2126181 RepID=A0A8H6SY09_9AGAR|nr:putative acyl-activating enzyme 1, peroxisomal [Mycena indigotica]KAF7306746.1 putative acyl-activating enzyme 1, peroxisomal [Mycena indigotica]
MLYFRYGFPSDGQLEPALMTFQPTPASIPPRDNRLTLRQPSGLPPNIQPLNPLQFILRAAEIYPNQVALVHTDSPAWYTYSVWCQRVQNLAYALLQAGVKPGDRVAVIAPNSPMTADAHHGVLAVQAVLCLINTRLKPSDVAYILEHSGSSIILVDHEYTHLLPSNLKVPVIVNNDTGKQGDPYEDFLTVGRKFSKERGWPDLEYNADENAAAVLCYTSGTTGRPKGVITTLRGSYLAAVANAYESNIRRDSTYLWILPMFHAGGWTFPWACVFAMGKQITMRTVDYPTIWKHFLNSSVTHYCGAPTVQVVYTIHYGQRLTSIQIGIVNDPAARLLKQKISAIIAGAAPTANLIGSLESIGITPIHVYGLTKSQYGPFTRNYPQDSWAKLSIEERSKFMARQGHSFATAQDVRVVYPPKDGSDQLVDVPRDGKAIGEIVTRGNIVMKEYFRDPEATAKAFRGGSFNSGDLAVMFEDGSIAIVDRQKDIIISGGENASSLAIEQELASHPDVLEVSVVARPHAKWGERPHAFVILKPHASKWKGKHDAFVSDLKEHAKHRLPGFARPEWITVVEELPKTSTGKIVKVELRKIIAKL